MTTQQPSTQHNPFTYIDFTPTRFEKFGHTKAAWLVLFMYASTLVINLVALWRLGIPKRNPFMLASLKDPIYISMIFVLVISSWFMLDFFKSAPRIYYRLYSQNVIHEKIPGESAAAYVKLYNNWMISPLRVFAGLGFMIFGFILSQQLVFNGLLGRLSPAFEKSYLGIDAEFYLVLWSTNIINSIIIMLSLYGGGTIIYKMIQTARLIYQIPNYFNLKLQPEHPDKVGGFKAIGELCLKMVYGILPVLLWGSFWLLASQGNLPSIVEPSSLPPYASSGIFSVLFMIFVFGMLVSCSLIFLWPMWTTHVFMRQRPGLNVSLNSFVREIEKLNDQLTSQHGQLSSEERKKLIEEINSLKTLYQQRDNLPSWPFERSIAIQFISVQLIPILSILFQGNSLIELVMNLLP